MTQSRIVIVGGGAAGFFAAITCAESALGSEVRVLERAARFLAKVRISGGGRCNVTHACFEPDELSSFYPRGGRELLGPFRRFQPRDTVAWFESRGVKLKTEADGRIFPISDSSETIIECLVSSAKVAGVQLVPSCGVEGVQRGPGTGFTLMLQNGETRTCDKLMLASGGCRSAAQGQLAISLGHTLNPPVPSLFTFHLAEPWIRELAGISLENVEISAPEAALRERGALLLTHSGVSGPVVLRLSAWGARKLHERQYQFRLRVHWVPHLHAEQLERALRALRAGQPARLVVNTPLAPIPGRLWQALVLTAGIPRETRWAALSNSGRHQLTHQLTRTELQVVGKTLNQEEFVTCGGVRLEEVNFKTMESRICPGLYLGGEVLDIDGLTGGFNFQSAWTTGWLAGNALAGRNP